MATVVGIFQLHHDAERARQQLHLLGVSDDKIVTLSPGTSDRQVQSAVRTSDSEGPGMGAAIGGTVGGAVGMGTGAALAAAAVSLLFPGVGLVLVAGVLGGAILGLVGTYGGIAAGSAAEDGLAGELPHDDLFVYEDALRKGRAVLLVITEESQTAELVRGELTKAGAESVDAARESWWLGLRDAEQEKYEGDFDLDAVNYRKGFETALRPGLRRRSFEEVAADSNLIPEIARTDRAFRSGYESGQSYQKALEEKHTA